MSLPPSPRLRQTSVALPEAGQPGPGRVWLRYGERRHAGPILDAVERVPAACSHRCVLDHTVREADSVPSRFEGSTDVGRSARPLVRQPSRPGRQALDLSAITRSTSDPSGHSCIDCARSVPRLDRRKIPSCGRLLHHLKGPLCRSTLPFSCPLDATKSSKRRQVAAQSEARNRGILLVTMRDPATSGTPPQRAANASFSAC